MSCSNPRNDYSCFENRLLIHCNIKTMCILLICHNDTTINSGAGQIILHKIQIYGTIQIPSSNVNFVVAWFMCQYFVL